MPSSFIARTTERPNGERPAGMPAPPPGWQERIQARWLFQTSVSTRTPRSKNQTSSSRRSSIECPPSMPGMPASFPAARASRSMRPLPAKATSSGCARSSRWNSRSSSRVRCFAPPSSGAMYLGSTQLTKTIEPRPPSRPRTRSR